MGSNEKAVFSCRGEVLEAKFGRSSKPSPRILVVTSSKFYIVSQMLANNQVQIVVERAFPLGTIKFISASTARDDWFSLGVGSPQEADPLLNCVFKTEMFTQMQRVMPGGFSLKITESIEYAKKPGKMQMVKVLKDSPSPVDFYKSGAVHTQPGESPNSTSKPLPKAKPVPPKPITRGKLIKPGGPNGRPSRVPVNRTPQPRPGGGPAPAAVTPPRPVPKPASRPVPGPAATIQSHTRNQSSTSATRVPPPPPPSAPPAKARIMAKVLYDFAGEKENELAIRVGDLVEIVQKESNGKADNFQCFIVHNTNCKQDGGLPKRPVVKPGSQQPMSRNKHKHLLHVHHLRPLSPMVRPSRQPPSLRPSDPQQGESRCPHNLATRA